MKLFIGDFTIHLVILEKLNQLPFRKACSKYF